MNRITQELINVTNYIIEKQFFEEYRKLLKPLINEYLSCGNINKLNFLPLKLKEKLNVCTSDVLLI